MVVRRWYQRDKEKNKMRRTKRRRWKSRKRRREIKRIKFGPLRYILLCICSFANSIPPFLLL